VEQTRTGSYPVKRSHQKISLPAGRNTGDKKEVIIMKATRFWIDEPLIVNGEALDRGFILDTSAGTIEWTMPIPGGETRIFDVADCTYLDGNPVSLEDGELIGEPEEEYLARVRK
jgi:hypothetical protein